MGYVADVVTWPEGLPRADRLLLCDAQTSGGLLIALPAAAAQGLTAELARRGVAEAAVIGRVGASGPGRIVVRAP